MSKAYRFNPQTLMYDFRNENGNVFTMKSENLWRNQGLMKEYGIVFTQIKKSWFRRLISWLREHSNAA